MVVLVVQPAADAKNIKLDYSAEPGLGAISADSARLHQIFWNLLSNAVKFTPVGGQVSLRTYRYRGSVRLAISDTGVGIPRHEIAKLGRPFEQVENHYVNSYLLRLNDAWQLHVDAAENHRHAQLRPVAGLAPAHRARGAGVRHQPLRLPAGVQLPRRCSRRRRAGALVGAHARTTANR